MAIGSGSSRGACDPSVVTAGHEAGVDETGPVDGAGPVAEAVD